MAVSDPGWGPALVRLPRDLVLFFMTPAVGVTGLPPITVIRSKVLAMAVGIVLGTVAVIGLAPAATTPGIGWMAGTVAVGGVAVAGYRRLRRPLPCFPPEPLAGAYGSRVFSLVAVALGVWVWGAVLLLRTGSRWWCAAVLVVTLAGLGAGWPGRAGIARWSARLAATGCPESLEDAVFSPLQPGP